MYILNSTYMAKHRTTGRGIETNNNNNNNSNKKMVMMMIEEE